MEKKKRKLWAPRGRLVVVSGASAGAGKDSIVKMFLKRHPDWHNPPSITTRRPRAGEVEAVDYYFVSPADFKARMVAGDFLETDFHAGNWYGTLKKAIDQIISANKNVIVRKDVNGAVQIKKKMPDAIVIFIDVESPDVLEYRIRERKSETEEQIQYRLELAKKEQEFKKHFDYIVINLHNRLKEAVDTIEKVVGL